MTQTVVETCPVCGVRGKPCRCWDVCRCDLETGIICIGCYDRGRRLPVYDVEGDGSDVPV